MGKDVKLKLLPELLAEESARYSQGCNNWLDWLAARDKASRRWVADTALQIAAVHGAASRQQAGISPPAVVATSCPLQKREKGRHSTFDQDDSVQQARLNESENKKPKREYGVRCEIIRSRTSFIFIIATRGCPINRNVYISIAERKKKREKNS